MAAQHQTTKCRNYYVATREEYYQPNSRYRVTGRCYGWDSLNVLWENDWWCNPPFSRKLEFIAKAREAQFEGNSGMMLLPYEPITKWWRENLTEDVIIYEPDGRYNFLDQSGTEKKGVNFASVLICFPAHKIGKAIHVQYKRGVGEEE